MASIKLAYVGGGSTRGVGTMASFIHQAANFAGSEVVLIDLVPDRLALVKRLARKMARESGADITIDATTDLRAGLRDCTAVLTSYRPGNFDARHLDESIPLKHNIIGQETQGPGGFFMALRSIFAMQRIVGEMREACPNATLFNYTNPINLVSQAVTRWAPDIRCYSFCEGPIMDAGWFAWRAGLDPAKLYAPFIGLNHGSWSRFALYEGQPFMPMLEAAWEKLKDDPSVPRSHKRFVELAVTMGALPNHYFQYYYFEDELKTELQAKPTTRAQDLIALSPGYWAHYRQQAYKRGPAVLDPAKSRGGIHELELAIDAMDAIYNNRREMLYVNMPNNGALADFDDHVVVERQAHFGENGAEDWQHGLRLPPHAAGLVKALGEYQLAAAEAAWRGKRIDAIRALASNPLVRSVTKAAALYDEMAAAHAQHLPARLLKP